MFTLKLNAPLCNTKRIPPPPSQSTVYNDDFIEEISTQPTEKINFHASSCNLNRTNAEKSYNFPLINQIMEMGFSKKSVELAVKTLSKCFLNFLCFCYSFFPF